MHKNFVYQIQIKIQLHLSGIRCHISPSRTLFLKLNSKLQENFSTEFVTSELFVSLYNTYNK